MTTSERFTPTGVGRTRRSTRNCGRRTVHPHGRGEDVEGTAVVVGSKRFTPTGVGRTPTSRGARARRPVHPHGRGEDPQGEPKPKARQVHPHGRGEDGQDRAHGDGVVRFTPTGVGRTPGVARTSHHHRFTPTGVGRTLKIRLHPRRKPGSPPRAWGGHRRVGGHAGLVRFTPTGVGRTGTDLSQQSALFGSPPRAWGGRRERRARLPARRFTPTGVGRTGTCSAAGRRAAVHPHGRGEDFGAARTSVAALGSPPRAWGGPVAEADEVARRRFTPTGVGRTRHRHRARGRRPVHPHGRGEDVRDMGVKWFVCGSPPRAWGGRPPRRLARPAWRFTPTGVGRTRARARLGAGRRFTPTGVGRTLDHVVDCAGHAVHPHGRGEDEADYDAGRQKAGSPPRAWGGRRSSPGAARAPRFTPTGVGRTTWARSRSALLAVHPHGRGEDVNCSARARSSGGSPPRAWGGRLRVRHDRAA